MTQNQYIVVLTILIIIPLFFYVNKKYTYFKKNFDKNRLSLFFDNIACQICYSLFFCRSEKNLIKLIFVKIVVSFHKKMLIYIKVGGENE